MNDNGWYNELNRHFRKKVFTKTEQLKLLPKEYRDLLTKKYLEKFREVNKLDGKTRNK